MLGYTAFFLGFIATLLGVLGKTRSDERKFPSNITVCGYMAILLAVASLVTSIIVKKDGEVEKDRYSFWAMRELEFATYGLLGPYMEHTDPAEPQDRFHLTKLLIEAGVFEGFCEISLHDSSFIYQGKTMGELCTLKTSRAVEDMGNILSRYSNYLSPEMVALITQVRTDPWTDIMLDARRMELTRTKQYGRKPYPFYTPRPRIQKLYLEKIKQFAFDVKNLEEKIGIEMMRIAKETKINNPPPAFLLPLNR